MNPAIATEERLAVERSDRKKESRAEQEPNYRHSRPHRVQLDFAPEAYERLQLIKKRSGARTNAEVIRNSLRLYEWFLEQREGRQKIQVVDKGGNIREVEFFL